MVTAKAIAVTLARRLQRSCDVPDFAPFQGGCLFPEEIAKCSIPFGGIFHRN